MLLALWRGCIWIFQFSNYRGWPSHCCSRPPFSFVFHYLIYILFIYFRSMQFWLDSTIAIAGCSFFIMSVSVSFLHWIMALFFLNFSQFFSSPFMSLPLVIEQLFRNTWTFFFGMAGNTMLNLYKMVLIFFLLFDLSCSL
jgi:hypothetical protein